MPASLTVQVRLGFSMGWRIWTPNEVGFYAKTLAHSYFILVILKSKFLKELIWIVNYNLFMGTKKYHVFIEFLKFGMKSKEERSFWKKIIFISLVARHKRLTKRFFHLRDEKYKINMFRTIVEMRYQQRRDRVILLKRYEADVFTSTRLALIRGHKKSVANLGFKSKVRDYIFNLGGIFKKFKLNNVIWKKIHFLRIVDNGFDKRSKNFLRKLDLKSKILTSAGITPKSSTKRVLLEKKNNKYKYFFTKIMNCEFSKVRSIGFGKKHEYGLALGLGAKNRRVGIAKNAIREEFRFDPIYEKDNYSIFGGPRKRLSRNLRRAFQGKYVKNVANLVWYWEKLSRMLTYYMHKHNLTIKRVL